jgi:ribosomal protein S18 acetylase RimI-like enzyme
VTERREVEIHPLQAAQLHFLEEAIQRPPGVHRRRLEQQAHGEVEYLVAWRQRPIGHVLIEWAGAQIEPMASALKHSPQIVDLLVIAELRSQGIGTLLMREAEQSIWDRGYRRVVLGVGVENTRARAFYERLGYVDPGFGPCTVTYPVVDPHGNEATAAEHVIYLVKELQ